MRLNASLRTVKMSAQDVLEARVRGQPLLSEVISEFRQFSKVVNYIQVCENNTWRLTLNPLKYTTLFDIPEQFFQTSSKRSHQRVITMREKLFLMQWQRAELMVLRASVALVDDDRQGVLAEAVARLDTYQAQALKRSRAGSIIGDCDHLEPVDVDTPQNERQDATVAATQAEQSSYVKPQTL